MPEQDQQFQYVKLPDGSYGKFAASADDATIRSAIEKDFPDAYKPPPTMMDRGMQMAGDFIKGAGKGALNTLSSADDWMRKHGPAFMTNQNFGFGPPADLEHVQQMATPTNTAQKAGYGTEQVGEFLAPGALEEKAIAAVPRAGRMAAKIAVPALSSGLVNKAQGGSFSGGAAMGAGAGLMGMGLKAVAPGIAESALNIRKLDRAYKAPGAIGKAILDETRGFRPGNVAESARDVLSDLNPQLEDAAYESTNMADLDPAHGELNKAFRTATRQGERTTASQLAPMMTHLSEDMSGNPIGYQVTPRQLLDLKRGFGNEFIHRWNPETMEGVKGTAGRTYHQMAQSFEDAVPEAAPLNRRIGALIPVAKRGESAELNAPTAQRAFHRVAAHTGAGIGALTGGYTGYHQGGAPGALVGGTIGLLAPEAMASPTTQMFAARTLSSPWTANGLRAAGGLALQLNKGKKTSDK